MCAPPPLWRRGRGENQIHGGELIQSDTVDGWLRVNQWELLGKGVQNKSVTERNSTALCLLNNSKRTPEGVLRPTNGNSQERNLLKHVSCSRTTMCPEKKTKTRKLVAKAADPEDKKCTD